jgi:hypothetical protein
LSILLIAPEIRFGGLLFQTAEFSAFGIYVKETSAIRPRGASDFRIVRATPAEQSRQA